MKNSKDVRIPLSANIYLHESGVCPTRVGPHSDFALEGFPFPVIKKRKK